MELWLVLLPQNYPRLGNLILAFSMSFLAVSSGEKVVAVAAKDTANRDKNAKALSDFLVMILRFKLFVETNLIAQPLFFTVMLKPWVKNSITS
ncbi:hypothetical protein [Nonlabens ponticola]|uniref:Uncharacterized protein n=1 Tax=Nonlabens ponticola TaxID=2496866 RepID=A0A3S9MZ50_9FLAO|nr:hypothetical protein [Nonlabens ponticola]AZQ44419.1 hypothetical protein EJ995_09255 [Nonlabens ponticola]